jgi:hypothetical protein
VWEVKAMKDRFVKVKIAQLALILVASMTYAAPSSIDLHGFSMNLQESTGGQAVAAFEITLPEQYSLAIPVLFFGNSEAVNISVVFDNTNFIDQDLDILSSELDELDYGSAADLSDVSYIIVDIDYYRSQIGELRVVLDSTEPAELFVLSPEEIVNPCPSPGKGEAIGHDHGDGRIHGHNHDDGECHGHTHD